MGLLEKKRESALSALIVFQREVKIFTSLDQKHEWYETIRSGTVHSFKMSLEVLWKYIKLYLYDIRKIDTTEIRSPRSVFRAALNDKVISQEEYKLCIDAIEDRNRTSHTYKEELAEKIARNCIQHCKTIETIINKLVETD